MKTSSPTAVVSAGGIASRYLSAISCTPQDVSTLTMSSPSQQKKQHPRSPRSSPKRSPSSFNCGGSVGNATARTHIMDAGNASTSSWTTDTKSYSAARSRSATSVHRMHDIVINDRSRSTPAVGSNNASNNVGNGHSPYRLARNHETITSNKANNQQQPNLGVEDDCSSIESSSSFRRMPAHIPLAEDSNTNPNSISATFGQVVRESLNCSSPGRKSATSSGKQGRNFSNNSAAAQSSSLFPRTSPSKSPSSTNLHRLKPTSSSSRIRNRPRTPPAGKKAPSSILQTSRYPYQSQIKAPASEDGARTEVMANLSSTPRRTQDLSEAGAPTEVMTNRTHDILNRYAKVEESVDASKESPVPQRPESARQFWQNKSGAKNQAPPPPPLPKQPQQNYTTHYHKPTPKVAVIPCLMDDTSNESSSIGRVAHPSEVPGKSLLDRDMSSSTSSSPSKGRLDQHVEQKHHHILNHDPPTLENGSSMDYSGSIGISSVGVETGGKNVERTNPALRPLFGGRPVDKPPTRRIQSTIRALQGQLNPSQSQKPPHPPPRPSSTPVRRPVHAMPSPPPPPPPRNTNKVDLPNKQPQHQKHQQQQQQQRPTSHTLPTHESVEIFSEEPSLSETSSGWAPVGLPQHLVPNDCYFENDSSNIQPVFSMDRLDISVQSSPARQDARALRSKSMDQNIHRRQDPPARSKSVHPPKSRLGEKLAKKQDPDPIFCPQSAASAPSNQDEVSNETELVEIMRGQQNQGKAHQASAVTGKSPHLVSGRVPPNGTQHRERPEHAKHEGRTRARPTRTSSVKDRIRAFTTQKQPWNEHNQQQHQQSVSAKQKSVAVDVPKSVNVEEKKDDMSVDVSCLRSAFENTDDDNVSLKSYERPSTQPWNDMVDDDDDDDDDDTASVKSLRQIFERSSRENEPVFCDDEDDEDNASVKSLRERFEPAGNTSGGKQEWKKTRGFAISTLTAKFEAKQAAAASSRVVDADSTSLNVRDKAMLFMGKSTPDLGRNLAKADYSMSSRGNPRATQKPRHSSLQTRPAPIPVNALTPPKRQIVNNVSSTEIEVLGPFTEAPVSKPTNKAVNIPAPPASAPARANNKPAVGKINQHSQEANNSARPESRPEAPRLRSDSIPSKKDTSMQSTYQTTKYSYGKNKKAKQPVPASIISPFQSMKDRLNSLSRPRRNENHGNRDRGAVGMFGGGRTSPWTASSKKKQGVSKEASVALIGRYDQNGDIQQSRSYDLSSVTAEETNHDGIDKAKIMKQMKQSFDENSTQKEIEGHQNDVTVSNKRQQVLHVEHSVSLADFARSSQIPQEEEAKPPGSHWTSAVPPQKSPTEDPALRRGDEKGHSSDTDYSDGVTLDLSIAEVSNLTNPSAIRSPQQNRQSSTESSEQETEGMDAEARKSEASSSQPSEAAAPLLAAALRLRPMSDELSRNTGTSARINDDDSFKVKHHRGAGGSAFGWDIEHVQGSFLGERRSASETSFGFERQSKADSFPLSDWQPFDMDDDPWGRQGRNAAAAKNKDDRLPQRARSKSVGSKIVQGSRPETPKLDHSPEDEVPAQHIQSQPRARGSSVPQRTLGISPRKIHDDISAESADTFQNGYELPKKTKSLMSQQEFSKVGGSQAQRDIDTTQDSRAVEGAAPSKDESSASSFRSDIDEYRNKSSLLSPETSPTTDFETTELTLDPLPTSFDSSYLLASQLRSDHPKTELSAPESAAPRVVAQVHPNQAVIHTQQTDNSRGERSLSRPSSSYASRTGPSQSMISSKSGDLSDSYMNAGKSDQSGIQSGHSTMNSRTQQLLERQQLIKTKKARMRGRSPAATTSTTTTRSQTSSISSSFASGYFGRTHPERPNESTNKRSARTLPASRLTPPEPLFHGTASDAESSAMEQRPSSNGKSKNSSKPFKFLPPKKSKSSSQSGYSIPGPQSIYQKFASTLESKNAALRERLKSVKEARLRRAASRSPRSVVGGIPLEQRQDALRRGSSKSTKSTARSSITPPDYNSGLPDPYSPPKPRRVVGVPSTFEMEDPDYTVFHQSKYSRRGVRHGDYYPDDFSASTGSSSHIDAILDVE